jgi:hypothetical protein
MLYDCKFLSVLVWLYIYIQHSCIALSSLFNRSMCFWATILELGWTELKVRCTAWKFGWCTITTIGLDQNV